jgi:hypothetical protein
MHKRFSFTKVVTGQCSQGGYDLQVEKWAKKLGLPYIGYPADWGKYGNSAGPIRNQQMLEEERPDMVVAFPGNNGTQDMIKKTIVWGRTNPIKLFMVKACGTITPVPIKKQASLFT